VRFIGQLLALADFCLAKFALNVRAQHSQNPAILIYLACTFVRSNLRTSLKINRRKIAVYKAQRQLLSGPCTTSPSAARRASLKERVSHVRSPCSMQFRKSDQ